MSNGCRSECRVCANTRARECNKPKKSPLRGPPNCVHLKSYYFCKLNSHATFHKPRTTPSERKLTGGEERKKKNNAVATTFCLQCRRAAHATLGLRIIVAVFAWPVDKRALLACYLVCINNNIIKRIILIGVWLLVELFSDWLFIQATVLEKTSPCSKRIQTALFSELELPGYLLFGMICFEKRDIFNSVIFCKVFTINHFSG